MTVADRREAADTRLSDERPLDPADADPGGVWRALLGLIRAIARVLMARRILLAIILVLGLVLWGGFEATRRFAPETYEHLRDQVLLFHAKHMVRGSEKRFETVDPSYADLDVAGRIRLHSATDVADRRRRAIEVIWGEAGFPGDALPDTVETEITDEYLSGLENVRRIDALDVVMERGQRSRVYYVHARRPNGRLVIYHQGHRGPVNYAGHKAIGALVDAGYDVLGVSMAMYSGPNAIEVEGHGRIWVTRHDEFWYFERPMAIYFQPIAAALNHALAETQYDDIAAIGFSGGGWTITVYAALDPRIRKSYPVSGTYPMHLRRYVGETWERPREYGQFMERYPPLYRAANYLELYVLGGHGAGRSQMQILSQYDSCCYGGMGWTTYADIVADRVRVLGKGRFSVVIDTSHAEHKLSRFAMDAILTDLAAD